MHIEELQLENFRGFAQLTIPFERHLTVLVGVNGSGKSSILDALAVLLAMVVRTNALPGEPRAFTDRDVRVECESTWALCKYVHEGRDGFYDERHRRRSTRGQRRPFDQHSRGSTNPSLVLPLAIYYPSRRSVLDTPERLREPHSFEPVDALDLALEARVDFRLFFEWFRDREDIENERRAQESTSYRDPALSAVREAIVAFMPNVSEPRVQRAPRQRFVLTKDGSTLEIDQLSDGERTLLALVGDLARRLSMANPTDALKHEAVVMIDEVELHLHPGLQRDVVAGLRRTFPNVQFILTTHSPFVLGAVPAESIRLLRNFKLETPTIETEHQPIGTISRELQGIPERSPVVDDLLQKAHAACDAQDLPEAEKQLAALRERVGASDPDVIRLESLLDLLAPG